MADEQTEAAVKRLQAHVDARVREALAEAERSFANQLAIAQQRISELECGVAELRKDRPG